MIRVLHLRDSPWVDGPGRTILETGTHVDAGRIDYHIGAFVPPGNDAHPLVEAARARGLAVHPIVDHGGVGQDLVSRIVDLMDEHGIDVLHTSEFRSNVIAQACRRRRRSVTLVVTAHGWIANDLRGRLFRVADKMLLRRFDAVIFVSRAMTRLVPRWWLGDERVHVLHNALVLDRYGTDWLRRPRRRAGEDGVVRMLNVGRLSPEKGQVLLLEAFAGAARDLPRVRLGFAGIGPMEAELRAVADRLGISGRVDFLGYIQDMPSLYADTDLVIQSSFTEGLPNVILEAAYLRVPILATAVGGTDEVVRDGVTAKLIQSRSRSALEEGIRNFLDDPAAYAAMAHAAHDDIRQRFSFAARTDRLMDIYEGLFR